MFSTAIIVVVAIAAIALAGAATRAAARGRRGLKPLSSSRTVGGAARHRRAARPRVAPARGRVCQELHPKEDFHKVITLDNSGMPQRQLGLE